VLLMLLLMLVLNSAGLPMLNNADADATGIVPRMSLYRFIYQRCQVRTRKSYSRLLPPAAAVTTDYDAAL
jgi:hypothetical protein